jgi:hypothetical protein
MAFVFSLRCPLKHSKIFWQRLKVVFNQQVTKILPINQCPKHAKNGQNVLPAIGCFGLEKLTDYLLV